MPAKSCGVAEEKTFRNILKTIALNKIKPFGAPSRRFVFVCQLVFLDKEFPNGNHTILRESGNTVVHSDEVANISNAYFSSKACEIGFKNEHATPEEAILA